MNQDEVDYQARKLVNFTKRGGSVARWWSSQGFNPDEAEAIEQAIRRLSTAAEAGGAKP